MTALHIYDETKDNKIIRYDEYEYDYEYYLVPGRISEFPFDGNFQRQIVIAKLVMLGRVAGSWDGKL